MKSLFAMFTLVGLGATPASAADVREAQVEIETKETTTKQWSFSAETAVYTKYVWRGAVLNTGPAFQPAIATTYKDLTLSLWGSLDMADANGTAGRFTEVDLTLDYSAEVGPVPFSVGAIHYRFPNTGDLPTTELYLGVTAPVLLSPTLTLYQDIDETEGLYTTLGIGHVFEGLWSPTDELSFSLSVDSAIGVGSANNNRAYFDVGKWALTDAMLGVSLPIQISEYITVVPSTSYTMLVSPLIRRIATDRQSVFAGISVGASL